MRCKYACQSSEHLWARRSFLGTLTGGMGALGMGAFGAGFAGLIRPAAAEQLASEGKRVLLIDLAGGVSQLESWDPKPRTETGGPFRAIPTSVPGVHISELLPHTAKLMHHLSIIRGINIGENDHGRARTVMETGRKPDPANVYPHLGSVAAKLLAPIDAALPGHILISPGGGGQVNAKDSAFLGPQYASVTLGGGKPPQNIDVPEGLSGEDVVRRSQLRQRANERFARRRRTAETDAYSYSYEQAAELMKRRDVFDVSFEPEADQQRYGDHDFGRHCLLARRLLEKGVTFVRVTHTNYDTHNENFNFHIEQLGEMDRPFATLLGDLADRGMLESTLVVVMSEFGRTPKINHRYGRDHWGTAWSIALGGAGIVPGAVYGATNDKGTEVVDGEVGGGHLFHTYLQALGIDSSVTFDIAGREIPAADPAAHPISELLA
ncbi:MAG: DUF1501 domain-containing protein [Planctomycetales bacterium]|nr:DUF1501 domain-containing protein [Planctomycetales bacterium]